ncbi:MAG: hypothetical protein FWB78_09495 [Treponema sp.]|nr:hypothetical protein [Treponema sp.]
MKKTFKLIGIIAAMAVIGFSMTACNQANDPAPSPPPQQPPSGPGQDQPPPPAAPSIIGTWENEWGNVLVFSGNQWQRSHQGNPYLRGTFTTSGTDGISITVTERHGQPFLASPVTGRFFIETFGPWRELSFFGLVVDGTNWGSSEWWTP